MSTYLPFQNGVTGALNIEWTLCVEEPLVIRNGSKAAFRTDKMALNKGRGGTPEMKWKNARALLRKDDNKYSEIADFNYSFKIENEQVICEYAIPASSLRGAMRNQAIKRLVEVDKRTLYSLPKKDGLTLDELERKIEAARDEMKGLRTGWAKILTLFGVAFELSEKEQCPLTWSGRLSLQTRLPAAHSSSNRRSVSFMGQDVDAADCPSGPSFTIQQRSPLDRVTQSAKTSGGGLHAWLELAKGETFDVCLRILNPCNQDIKMLSLWREEVDTGFLRFGGLQSIGKGEARLQKESYKLHLLKNSPLVKDLLKVIPEEKQQSDDLFSGIWFGGTLPSFDALCKLDLDVNDLRKQGA